MPKKPVPPFNRNDFKILASDEIEDSFKINQKQLNSAKLFASREEYAKSLKQNIKYLEIGVAWGYSAELFASNSNASLVHLVDWYNQDLKCWSWRKFGSCQCEGFKHELLYTPETHEEYIINKFKNYNTKTFKGDAKNVLPSLTEKYDFIYIDITNDRLVTREILELSAKLVLPGGIIGLNDYLIYDGVIEDEPYGTFQTVNEFLHMNQNWEVDAIALHNLGFYDIYIKKAL